MPHQIPPAAVSRFKFAVPIVADMLNKRYRRRQFDSADSEFGDLEKTEYKENPLLSGGGFSLSINLLFIENGVSSVACFVGFASCKTFGKQPKRPCFGA